MDNKLVLYQAQDGSIELKLDAENQTIWASQSQIAEVFGIDRTRITRHIANIFADSEVNQKSNVRKTHIANSDKPINLYSLDIILAVGYRTNSKQAIKFRQWSTSILKGYMIRGVVVNEKRLGQLGQYLEIISRSEISEVAGVGEVTKKYVNALHLLEDYDSSDLDAPKGDKEKWQLTYSDARKFLDELKISEAFGDNFANERSSSFGGIIAGLYQTFGGNELYGSVQEKAANLLYQVVKDHPFFDGNKRSAAALFIYFLAKNGVLRDISSNTLAATTLMVALSRPGEKDQIILLVRNFLDNTK